MNKEAKQEFIEKAIKEIMYILEIDKTDSNRDTPKRVAKMLINELFENLNVDEGELESQMTTFNAPDSQPISIKNIKFTSTCEHHWLPFMGYVDIEYIPGVKVLGLSKFPRVVKWFSKKPQMQETLTKEIGEFLANILEPKYLKVVIHDTQHTCVSARGIESDCSTDTKFEYKGDK